MQSDTFMLYKLIILYILSRVKFPLTNAQLIDFILEKEYTNYINIQQAITELLDDEFISSETIHNSSMLSITESGLQTLHFFDNMISQGIKDDIEDYLAKNKHTLQEKVSTTAEMYFVKKGEYQVRLKAVEMDTTLIDLSLTVTSEEEANAMCSNWKNKSSDIYAYLMSSLLEN